MPDDDIDREPIRQYQAGTKVTEAMRVGICQDCDAIIKTAARTAPIPKRCPECTLIDRRAVWMRYYRTEKGQAAVARSQRRLTGTAKRRASSNKANERYRQSAKGAITRRLHNASYLSRPEVRARRSELKRQYNRQGRYRILKRQHDATRQLRSMILPRSCAYCDGPAQDLDHAVPVSICLLLGIEKPSGEWNLQWLCRPCHRWKSKLDYRDFMQLRKVV